MGRFQLLKLKIGKSTKPERIIGEFLKRSRIKFRTKVKLAGKEIDFLIKNKYVLEIGNHQQNPEKNAEILESGYKLMWISNDEIKQNIIKVKEHLLLWLQV